MCGECFNQEAYQDSKESYIYIEYAPHSIFLCVGGERDSGLLLLISQVVCSDLDVDSRPEL